MRTELWILLASIAATTSGTRVTEGALAATPNTLTVTSFGAIGDGTHNDTHAIQAALDALEAQGGGILLVPKGTYLLNSYSPSPHPWFFYNLLVGSNITIQANPGAKFLQGPSGRAPIPRGASEVRNSVLVFGSRNYVIDTFQTPSYNGGFYRLNATRANDLSVTLSTPSQASKFMIGDYVAIYSAVPVEGVIPSESSRVTSVSPSGVLGLAHPLARAFGSPGIANVSSLATVNIGVTNLIVEGTEPVAINEVFGFSATGNTFISDTSIGGGNTYGLNMNNIRGCNFVNNVVTSNGPPYGQELPQRNSQDVVLNSNTFLVTAAGFGEYSAHWTITQNTFTLRPSSVTQGAALALGGLDILFSNNHVQGSAPGDLPLMVDFLGMDQDVPYIGQVRILNNTVDCNAGGSTCLKLVATDTVVSNNHLNLTGSGQVILVEGPLPQSVKIQSNTVSVQSGLGIVLNSKLIDNSNISCNTITGTGPIGIYVTSPATPNQGQNILFGNTIVGFASAINIDPSKHPGTVISSVSSNSVYGICPSQ